MMRLEDGFIVGDKLYYSEFGRVDKVEVVKNLSDASDSYGSEIRYRLKVLENIYKGEKKDGRFDSVNQLGLEFICFKLRISIQLPEEKMGLSQNWHLTREKPNNINGPDGI